MKGVVSTRTSGSSSSNNGGGGRVQVVGRIGSEKEKEKTKMRERQRRAITTNIFHGLRKHGGYQLSPRADINQVLRELAREAGWVIEPDGTTYRSTTPNACCPLCGAGKRNAAPTPTSTTTNSTVAVASGECSTSASPRCFAAGDSTLYLAGTASAGVKNGLSCLDHLTSGRDIPFTIYDLYGNGRGGGAGDQLHQDCYNPSFGGGGVAVAATAQAVAVAYQQQLQERHYLQEARASNHNTPMGSPSPHV